MPYNMCGGPAVRRNGNLNRAYVNGNEDGVNLNWNWTENRWNRNCWFVVERTMVLLKEVIESFSWDSGKGLPLGNLTSQLFVNVYMNPFDQFVKHRLRRDGISGMRTILSSCPMTDRNS